MLVIVAQLKRNQSKEASHTIVIISNGVKIKQTQFFLLGFWPHTHVCSQTHILSHCIAFNDSYIKTQAPVHKERNRELKSINIQ